MKIEVHLLDSVAEITSPRDQQSHQGQERNDLDKTVET